MASPAAVDSAEILRLHARVLAGDSSTREQLAAVLLEVCPRLVLRVRLGGHPNDVGDAVERAVSSYLDSPASFDPSRLSLMAYIARAALRNLADRDRAERRRRVREAAWAQDQARLTGAARTRAPVDVWPLLLGSRGALTDYQWRLVASWFPARLRTTRGRPAGPTRTILDGVIEVLRAGGHWQHLPDGYPPWQTCYRHFRQWCQTGALRNALDRLEADLLPSFVRETRGPRRISIMKTPAIWQRITGRSGGR